MRNPLLLVLTLIILIIQVIIPVYQGESPIYNITVSAEKNKVEVPDSVIVNDFEKIKITATVKDVYGRGIAGVEVKFKSEWYSPEKGTLKWGHLYSESAITDSNGNAVVEFDGSNSTDPAWREYWRPNPVTITATVGIYNASTVVYIKMVKSFYCDGYQQLRYYRSSIDNVEMEYYEYIPKNFDPKQKRGLMIILHPMGEKYDVAIAYPGFRPKADEYGLILAAPLNRKTEIYGYKSLYINSPYPGAAPGEQDILDLIPHISKMYKIDEKRIYLTGYSMGGLGTIGIASRRPGIFAAIAPGASASDLNQLMKYFRALENSGLSIDLSVKPEYYFGADPEKNITAKSRLKMASPRFILENLINTPVYFFHGDFDEIIPNNEAIYPYMQAKHIVDTPGFTDEYGRAITLNELQKMYGDKYFIEKHEWVPVGPHVMAPLIQDGFKTVDWFMQWQLDPLAESTFIKTYDYEHTKNLWAQIKIKTPYEDEPGYFYGRYYTSNNSLHARVNNLNLTIINLRQTKLTLQTDLKFNIEFETPAKNFQFVLDGRFSEFANSSEIYIKNQSGNRKLTPVEFQINDTRLTIYMNISKAEKVELLLRPKITVNFGVQTVDSTSLILNWSVDSRFSVNGIFLQLCKEPCLYNKLFELTPYKVLNENNGTTTLSGLTPSEKYYLALNVTTAESFYTYSSVKSVYTRPIPVNNLSYSAEEDKVILRWYSTPQNNFRNYTLMQKCRVQSGECREILGVVSDESISEIAVSASELKSGNPLYIRTYNIYGYYADSKMIEVNLPEKIEYNMDILIIAVVLIIIVLITVLVRRKI